MLNNLFNWNGHRNAASSGMITFIMLLGVMNNTFAQARLSDDSDAPLLNLELAIEVAQQKDHWLEGSQYRESALLDQSSAATSLPDPKVSLTAGNFPLDTLDIHQEPMTQMVIGVTQMFPRGDSLNLSARQKREMALQEPMLRLDRLAQVKLTVTQLWLNAYQAQQSIRLIEQDRYLFQQLIDATRANYASALGRARQQNIIRAQLELTRLDDRLTELKFARDTAQQRLSEWVGAIAFYSIPSDLPNVSAFVSSTTLAGGTPALPESNESFTISAGGTPALPEGNEIFTTSAGGTPALPESNESFTTSAGGTPALPEDSGSRVSLTTLLAAAENKAALYPFVENHPSLLALKRRLQATQTQVALAQQKYKPEWGITASYGYRAEDQNGNTRADLASVGITFDLPIFTGNRQDREVSAAKYQSESIKTDEKLLARQLISRLGAASVQLQNLNERYHLYTSALLPQTRNESEAVLNAYNNDDGDFAEAVRSQIALLNAKIEALAIAVAQQQTLATINYLTSGYQATNNLTEPKGE
ncbi:MAG: TolC family protein [Oleibacter sp.]|nr:TolC family protein [Thalassolituus sp.]